MPDYSQVGIPRPAPIGREVRLEQRRANNRAIIFALSGVLVLCVCMCAGVFLAASVLGLGPLGQNTIALNLPLGARAGATPTPPANGTPTAVPLLKSGQDGAGLRLTVSNFTRPLPAQPDVEIPSGQELALVTLRIENTRKTGGPIKYSIDDFQLVSPEGDEFHPNIEGITTGDLLKSGEIAAGKSVKGDLIFYVYSDVKDLMLAWTSGDGVTRLFKLARQ